VTVPVLVRRRYGLQPGDEVEFRVDRGGLLMVPLRRRPLSEFRGLFRAKSRFIGRDAIRQKAAQRLGAELEVKLPRR
jgi:bifunctional DNA-binding transcriptional regulator/antitoxin component of YhaV-PrlF toxin-antitoxin module